MSYQPAYHTSFDSIDGRRWNVVISINADDGETIDDMEISLEGDEPCIIEWAETDKQDVVQASTCTLRVSNESDRQMVQLMTRRDAVVSVGVDGRHYWFGHLDDSIYEEPYSFTEGYVAELIFSDFGILSRKPFRLTGRQCVHDIVVKCLELTDSTRLVEMHSLRHVKSNAFVFLRDLYINADRFRADSDGWGEYTSKREALEEVLRPLGLRLIQKNGEIIVYDIEWMRDEAVYHAPVRWKGTDAYLRGSETYGWYEVGFEPDAEEILAEDPIKARLESFTVPGPYHAAYYDDEVNRIDVGFYIWLEGVTGTDTYNGVRSFKTRPHLSSGIDIGHAWIVHCQNRIIDEIIPPRVLTNPFVYWPVSDPQGIGPVAEAIFEITSSYLPLVPDRDKYQLRVNLDLLLTPLQNPLEGADEWNLLRRPDVGYTIEDYKTYWTDPWFKAYVPVKLELLNDDDTVAMHYKNMYALTGYHRNPYPIGMGEWKGGPADFGDMMLAYYNDGCETTALEGWATNRQTMPHEVLHLPSLYAKRAQGEYVPMPYMAGRLRLTVSNCVYSPSNGLILHSDVQKRIKWHMLKDAKITLVKANTVDDGIPVDTVYYRDAVEVSGDKTSETIQANTWEPGVAPSARGLFFNAYGMVYEEFIKNNVSRTLSGHRVKCHEDQTLYVQPVLSGTAELNIYFQALTDANTPGVFLVTAQRQDLHQGTEELTMARIADVGRFVYETRWSGPVCVMEEVEMHYDFVWRSPVCALDEEQ